MSSQMISDAFTNAVLFAISKPLLFQSFRQWVKYMCHAFGIGDEAKFFELAHCRQFGHGQSTSSAYYGRSSDESDLVRSVDLAAYRK